MKLRGIGTLSVMVFAISALLLASTCDAQGRQGRGGQRGQAGGQRGMMGGRMMGGGRMGGGAGLLSLLLREDVQKDKALGLLKDQIDEAKGLQEKQREQMREMFSGMQGMSQEERGQLGEKMRKAAEKTQEQVKEILLPHQNKRLEQIGVQMRMRGSGIRGLLRDPQMREKIGVSEDEAQELTEKAAKIEAELRKEALKKLLESMTSGQRKTIEDMIGEPFEMEEQPRGQGGPGGQRGLGGRAGGQNRPQRPARPGRG